MKNKIIGISVMLLSVAFISTSCSTSTASELEEGVLVSTGGGGEELFKSVCTKCHRTSMPSGKEEMQAMKAPPIMGVMFHVNDGVKVKNDADKRQAVIDFIIDYAHNPSADKSFCEKHAIQRFGVMPSQKENITKEELTSVANYLYDTYPSGSTTHEELQKKMGVNGNHHEGKEGCKEGKKGCSGKDKKGCNH